MAIELVHTHLKGLDNLFGGGVRLGSCVLLISAPIIEAKIFLLEYIYRGVKAGEPGLFITTDNSPEELDGRAAECGWEIEEDEIDLLRWIDAYSYNLSQNPEPTKMIKRIGGVADVLGDLSINIKSIMDKFARIDQEKQKGYCYKCKREVNLVSDSRIKSSVQFRGECGHILNNYSKFVFDSISPIIINQGIKGTYRFLRQMISRLRAFNALGFFVLGKGMHPPEVEMMIRHSMDGCIEINEKMRLTITSPLHPGVRGSGLL